MCHTFLASLQQIFQNPLDDFHTQWYFSCKSHCSCGLVWTFPQDVVVFILNTASPWIIPERSTAPQHTRFILPPFHPTKSSLRCVGGIFLLGSCTLKISWADRTWYRLFVNAAAQTGAGTAFGANGDPITWAEQPLLVFCVLTIRKHLLKMRFERSGRGQDRKSTRLNSSHIL